MKLLQGHKEGFTPGRLLLSERFSPCLELTPAASAVVQAEVIKSSGP